MGAGDADTDGNDGIVLQESNALCKFLLNVALKLAVPDW
jgi:hypothetical protein